MMRREGLTREDLQPVVDALVSLHNVRSLRVQLVPGGVMSVGRGGRPMLNAAQKAALAAVAPAP